MTESGLHGIYFVVGPPGTGKTSWVVRQVQTLAARTYSRYDYPAIVLSLSRTAAAEVRARKIAIPLDAIGTTHHFAWMACGKPRTLRKHHIESWNAEHPSWAIPTIPERSHPITCHFASTVTAPGEPWRQADCMARGLLYLPEDRSLTVRAFGDAWASFRRSNLVVDYGDVIEQAIGMGAHPYNPAVLLVDEAQDCNPAEIALILYWAHFAEAVIFVGDPWQALYTWRGAKPSLLDYPVLHPESPWRFLQGILHVWNQYANAYSFHKLNLQDHAWLWESSIENFKVLRQSYRVPRVIRTVAMDWVSQLRTYTPTVEYCPRDVQGAVQYLPSETAQHCPRIIAELERALEENSSDTYMLCALCRHTIAKIVAHLKRKAIPFACPWRPTELDWNPLYDRNPLLAFLRPFMRNNKKLWQRRELSIWAHAINYPGILPQGEYISESFVKAQDVFNEEGLADMKWLLSLIRTGAPKKGLFRIVQWFVQHTIPRFYPLVDYTGRIAMQYGLDALSTAPRVFVGTVHAFKGAEADHVVLFPEISIKAMSSWYDRAATKDEIVRVFYVAATRARETFSITNVPWWLQKQAPFLYYFRRQRKAK